MADPLENDDFDDFGSRAGVPLDIDTRTNLAESTAYQPPLEDPIRKGELRADRELPESGNAQLNRTARQVGSALGGVVSQARRLPDSARRGLHLVRDRAQGITEQTAGQVSGSASSLAANAQERIREVGDVARQAGERAQQRAGEWMDFAEARARELMDKTLNKTDEFTTYLAERTEGLRRDIDERTRELRNDARIRVFEARLRARYAIREHPLEILGCVAGAAFVVGVALRIVRSRNASRY